MTQTLTGPNGLRIVLDSREIVPSDPGLGTPAMVYLAQRSGTYWCALDTGELDGEYVLSDAQCRWIDAQFDTVSEFVERYTPAV